MKSSNIGGQAVLEGIMMKNGSKYAVAVRKPDGEIEIKTDEYNSIVKWKHFHLRRQAAAAHDTRQPHPRSNS